MHATEVDVVEVPAHPELWDYSEADWPHLTLHGALDRACEEHGPATVAWSYVDEGVDLTLGAARERARDWASSMVAAGVRPGDRVAVCLGATHLWPIVQLAIGQCGAAIVSVNIRYRTHELRHVLATSKPTLVLTSGDTDRLALATLVRDTVADVAGETRSPAAPVVVVDGAVPDGCVTDDRFLAVRDDETAATRRAAVGVEDTVLIQFTSGSTAAPKGVELSHDAVLTTAFQVGRAAGLGPSDVVYSALPFYHVGGSICTGVAPYVVGSRMVVPQRYEALGSVRQMIDHACTAVQGHAAMFTMQIDAARDAGLLAELRLTKGWAAAPPSVMRRIAHEMGIAGVVPVYGMSEFGLIAAGSRLEALEARVADMGSPPPGADVRVRYLPGEEMGEIEVRGRQMLSRYHGAPEATRLALTADGWLRTGDLARLGADGRPTFAGRAKDMIKPGGENVSAAEVEEFLVTHPDIASAAVIGIPDDRLGEAVAAVIATRPGSRVDLAAVQGFCEGAIASFKTPKAVFVVDALPIFPNGKVDKRSVRNRWGQGKETN
ncbi:class I adenylate-forming enzyme family protein [Nocardioides sp. LHD-245]|uniref:class I adenylate-forming enzyme family protein n=1 Tax=Nocardioides sp. LHD-245 TaxID=3051387 RepID=UPI0027E04228|nr:class I adenylate-forming enzyme family protein [Nocardioides sp. LHD-245]